MAAVVIRSEQRDNSNKDNTSRETTGLSRDVSEKLKQNHITTESSEEKSQITTEYGLDGDVNDDVGTDNENVEPSKEQKPDSSKTTSSVVYDVEHLATFSTAQNNVKLPQTSNKTQSGNNNKLSSNGKQLSGSDEDNNYNNDANNEEHFEKLCLANLESECREPRQALQKLFMLEKFSGIWTQRMQIRLKGDLLLIIDCETNSTVERFHRDCVIRPEAISHYNDIYNNIIVFVIQQRQQQQQKQVEEDSNHTIDGLKSKETKQLKDCGNSDKLDGELHIFQCVSHKAQQLVSDILDWKRAQQTSVSDPESKMANSKSHVGDDDDSCRAENGQVQVDGLHRTSSATTATTTTEADQPQKRTTNNKTTDSSSKPMVTVASSASNNESLPIANVNVKETVQVFNQIAALREKSKPTSPTGNPRPTSDTSNSATSSSAMRSPDLISRDSALESAGQLYKQRSIRATLTPKQQQQTSNISSADLVHLKSGSSNNPQQKQRSHTNYGSSISSTSASDVTKSSSSASTSTSTSTSQQPNPSQVESMIQHSSSHIESEPLPPTASMRNIDPVAHRQRLSPIERSGQQQQQKSSKSSRRTKDLEVPLPNYEQNEQVTTNESYVSVLNHCFDDIEKFILRLQQAAAAKRELYTRRKLLKHQHRNGTAHASDLIKNGNTGSSHELPPISAAEFSLLTAKASGPNEDDFFEILSKFKLAFNLLAKLKGCIHEPNAPELVHFLFTPLAIVIESARNVTPPVDPTLVNVPYLNRDALELLSNCCTSKESDLWLSLGPNWTQTIDIKILKASRLPNSFQPIFTDGWAPVITELELIGLVAPTTISTATTRSLSPPYIPEHGSSVHLVHDPMNVPEHINISNYQAPINGSSTSSSSAIYRSSRNSAIAAATAPNGSSTKTLSGSSGYLRNGNRSKRHSPNQLVHGKLSSNSYESPLHLDESRFVCVDDSVISGNVGATQSSRTHRSANRSKRPGLVHENIPSTHIQQQAHQNRSKSHSRRALAADSSTSRFYDPLLQADCDLNHHAVSPYLDGSKGMPNECVDLRMRNTTVMHNNYSDYERQLHLSPGGSSKEIRHDRLDPRQVPYHIGRHDHHGRVYSQDLNPPPIMVPFERMSELEREAMLLDLGPAQTEWFFELQARGAMIVRVLFTREANNDKELSVQRGELLEILDDSRKWWKARNIDLQVAHVPHTIVARMQVYQTLDELLTGDNSDYGPVPYHDPHRRDLSEPNYHYHDREDRPSRKTVGAFRYF